MVRKIGIPFLATRALKSTVVRFVLKRKFAAALELSDYLRSLSVIAVVGNSTVALECFELTKLFLDNCLKIDQIVYNLRDKAHTYAVGDLCFFKN